MKSRTLNWITAMILFTQLAMPVWPAALEQPSKEEAKQGTARYAVTDLGPVGPAGQPFSIKNNGLISGAAAVADGTNHAVLWYKGMKVDIGTPGLGGANSEAFGVNERGLAVGEAETSDLDPNGEDFCGFKSLGLPSFGNACVAFQWQHHVMTPLPTLGGNNGVANAINNQGQVVGQAENTSLDSSCPPYDPANGQYQKFQFKPVTWSNGQVQEFPTVSDDPDGVALVINDNGQVAGASGNCSTFSPQFLIALQPLHAVLWQNGTSIDLGSLGGTGHGFGNVALGINNQGQVVGSSDLPGDTTFHGFLWAKETGMQDLGTVPGDVASSAIAINDSGEVVGVSLDSNFNIRAFVRQNGVPIDLNTLIPAGSPLFLLLACSINSQGEIIGLAVNDAGELHGYLATPANSVAASENSSAGTDAATRSAPSPEAARDLLLHRKSLSRFGR